MKLDCELEIVNELRLGGSKLSRRVAVAFLKSYVEARAIERRWFDMSTRDSRRLTYVGRAKYVWINRQVLTKVRGGTP